MEGEKLAIGTSRFRVIGKDRISVVCGKSKNIPSVIVEKRKDLWRAGMRVEKSCAHGSPGVAVV